MAPNERILIARSASRLMFIDYRRVTKVLMPGTQSEYSATVEQATHPIKFVPGPIEGAPEVAGGSTYILTERDAEAVGMPYNELCAYIKSMALYGQDYAFLDDAKAADQILDRMRRQALKENEISRDAQAEGIMRSSMAVPSSRVR